MSAFVKGFFFYPENYPEQTCQKLWALHNYHFHKSTSEMFISYIIRFYAF